MEDIDVVEMVEKEEQLEVDPTPRDRDLGWTQYVLDQLSLEELYNGFPTVDGLRRVTEEIFGNVTSSLTTLLEVPDKDCTKCTASHKLVVQKYNGHEIIVNAVVDVIKSNTPKPFDKFIVATADSRAEGKAYRRLLKLKILSAEEMNNVIEEDTHTLVDPQVITAMANLCKKQDLNLLQIVKQFGGEYKSIDQMPKQVAMKICKIISNNQNDKKELSAKKFHGFDSNWKN